MLFSHRTRETNSVSCSSSFISRSYIAGCRTATPPAPQRNITYQRTLLIHNTTLPQMHRSCHAHLEREKQPVLDQGLV